MFTTAAAALLSMAGVLLCFCFRRDLIGRCVCKTKETSRLSEQPVEMCVSNGFMIVTLIGVSVCIFVTII